MVAPCFPQPNLWLVRCASRWWTALKKFAVPSTQRLRVGGKPSIPLRAESVAGFVGAPSAPSVQSAPSCAVLRRLAGKQAAGKQAAGKQASSRQEATAASKQQASSKQAASKQQASSEQAAGKKQQQQQAAAAASSSKQAAATSICPLERMINYQ